MVENNDILTQISMQFVPKPPIVSMSLLVQVMAWHWRGTDPGGRLNKKDGLTRYGDSHVKDKTS